MKRILEICCTSLEDAKIASDNGADRIELCEDLEVGGVTPNLKLLESVLNNIALPVFVLVRPKSTPIHIFYFILFSIFKKIIFIILSHYLSDYELNVLPLDLHP